MTFAGLWLPSADGSRHRLTRATGAIDMLYLGNESVGEGGLPSAQQQVDARTPGAG